MKPLVYIWILGLLVTGFVAVLFPPEDVNVYPTKYETVVQPVSVPAPAQPVDVSVVQRVAVQADALAVSVQRAEDKAEAIAGRLQTIEDGQTKLADADKALRVYVDEQDGMIATEVRFDRGEMKARDLVLFAWFSILGLFACAFAGAALWRSRKGGTNAARKDH